MHRKYGPGRQLAGGTATWVSFLVLLWAPAACGWTQDVRDVRVEGVLVRLVDEVEVPARVPGVLEEVAVREGHRVDADTVLARVDDDEAVFASNRAELELKLAEDEARNDVRVRFATKAFEVNRAEYARAVESDKKYKRSVSQSELETLRLTMERSKLEIEQATHEQALAHTTQSVRGNELAFAQWKLKRHAIISPFQGVVVQLYKSRGEWVEPGDKVIRIVRMDRLRAEGFLDASQAAPDLVGSPTEVTVNNEHGEPLACSGTLVFVSPEIDPVNGQVRVWAEFENADGQLRPGMRGSMLVRRSAGSD